MADRQRRWMKEIYEYLLNGRRRSLRSLKKSRDAEKSKTKSLPAGTEINLSFSTVSLSITLPSQNQRDKGVPRKSECQIKVEFTDLPNQNQKSESRMIGSELKMRSENQNHQSTTAPLSPLPPYTNSFPGLADFGLAT